MLLDHEFFDVDEAFEGGLASAGQLWSRLGETPDFAGKDVLEVGSGLGFLTASIALKGPKSILGVDIWEPRVEWSTKKLASRFPELSNVKFGSTPTDQMPGSDQFDIIVSQNTFEHIDDLDAVLGSFRRLLKPGGRAYVGFSPLYHSPFGDHGELNTKVRLPWLHLIAGEKAVIASFNKTNRDSVKTLQACGFNGKKPKDFRAAFERSGLEIEDVRVNRADGGGLKQAAMDAFSTLAKVPGLEPYFTVGMYAKLRKPIAN